MGTRDAIASHPGGSAVSERFTTPLASLVGPRRGANTGPSRDRCAVALRGDADRRHCHICWRPSIRFAGRVLRYDRDRLSEPARYSVRESRSRDDTDHVLDRRRRIRNEDVSIPWQIGFHRSLQLHPRTRPWYGCCRGPLDSRRSTAPRSVHVASPFLIRKRGIPGSPRFGRRAGATRRV